MTIEQAQAQMTRSAARLEQLYPPSNTGKSVVVDRMQDALVHNVRFTLYLLLGAVGVVLLIACANMANLLLAKSTGRTREMAIRAAVGAGRGRIVRQLIVESAVLALGRGRCRIAPGGVGRGGDQEAGARQYSAARGNRDRRVGAGLHAGQSL